MLCDGGAHVVQVNAVVHPHPEPGRNPSVREWVTYGDLGCHDEWVAVAEAFGDPHPPACVVVSRLAHRVLPQVVGRGRLPLDNHTVISAAACVVAANVVGLESTSDPGSLVKDCAAAFNNACHVRHAPPPNPWAAFVYYDPDGRREPLPDHAAWVEAFVAQPEIRGWRCSTISSWCATWWSQRGFDPDAAARLWSSLASRSIEPQSGACELWPSPD